VQVPPLQCCWAHVVTPVAVYTVGVRVIQRYLVDNAIVLGASIDADCRSHMLVCVTP
jgi:hypothetical protein